MTEYTLKIMDNDIDIEEHNILENPALKAIFPDITALKQELDFENEGLDTFQKGEINHTNSISNYGDGPNTENTSHSCPTKVNKTVQRQDFLFKGDNWFGNRIILGSKPRKRSMNYNFEHEDITLKKAIITLPDVLVELNNSEKFCKHCLILFPSVQRVVVHIETTHPKMLCDNNVNLNKNIIKIANKCEIECESTTSKIMKLSSTITDSMSNVPCFHCINKFPDKQTLIDHLYEVLEPKLNKKKVQNENDVSKVTHSTYAKIEEKKAINKSDHETKGKDSKNKDATNIKEKEEMFFQCHICTYYFKSDKFYSQHMYNKHGINNSSNKAKFGSKCTYCSLHCNDTKSYNRHVYNRHNAEIVNKINKLKHALKGKCIPSQNKNELEDQENIQVSEHTTKVDKKKELFFQCHVCSYYFNDEKFFSQHMLNKHRIKKALIRKVNFNPMCMFCCLYCHNIKSYNKHLCNRHREKIHKQNNELKQTLAGSINPSNKPMYKSKSTKIDVVPKSALFKCCQCDMHFISPTLALNHIEHMEILINWKCSKCNLIFKRNESLLHIKQHQSLTNFTIYKISDDIFSKLLYCCPKCTIHFQEVNFIQHYSICEDHTPQSVHCSMCDILIDSEIKSFHQNSHNKGNLNKDEFIIIDIIDDGNKEIRRRRKHKNIVRKKRTLEEKFNFSNIDVQRYHLYCCTTCKCFVSKVYKVYVHRKSQCTQILKYPCKFCGLILTGKGIMAHRTMHYENKHLKLQDFTFYNLENGKKICPPIPELPKCESCKIHFLYRNDIRSHECGEGNNKVCPFCEIILCEAAYKVHLPFHKYELKVKTHKNSNDATPTTSCPIPLDSEIEESVTIIDSNTNIDERFSPVVYCCKICFIRVDSYDKVIEHCQLHLTSSEKVVKTESYQNFDVESMKLFNFDTFYYGSENDVWLNHVYGSITKDHINTLLLNSIYRHESRIKMEISQAGNPAFTEYKCEKCHCFVDCLSLFKHVVNCLITPKKYNMICEVCKFPFEVKDSLDKHLQIHRQFHIPKSSFRIISFNKAEHKHINKLIESNASRPYVVYRCRNCEGLVNKSGFASHICNLNKLKECGDCGLLLYDIDHDSHVLKHKQLDSFTGNNIKVILLGYNIPQPNKEASLCNIKNSFIGIVCDYSFYKCSKCEVCIRDHRSTSKHYCLVDSGKAKCTNCDLYFDEGKLKSHFKLHSNDPDFVKDNIFTISFDPSENKQQNNTKINHIASIDDNDTNKVKDIVVVEGKESIIEKITKIYKCVKCNIHFLSESSAKEHVKKRPSRSLSQQCTKCGFAFSPNNLFKHLLEHHGKKNIVYKFEVVVVSGDFKKQKIYMCSKCSLHFTNSKKMYDHYEKCLGDSTDGGKCKCCGVMFHFSYLLNHERMHENNTHVDYEVVTTDVNC